MNEHFFSAKITIILNESTEVQTLGVIRYSYNINILSKYSSLISHRPSMFEGRHIDYRSSKVDTSITDLSKVDTSIIGLRRSTHPSPKVDTSIFESQHIDLRRSTHRDTSIFEGRHIDLRRATHRSSKVDTSIMYKNK